METRYTTITLPVPVKEALEDTMPPGFTYYGYLIHALDLDVDPADL